MGKILFWVLIGVLAYVAWRVYTVGQRRPGAPGGPGADSNRMGSQQRDPLGEDAQPGRAGQPMPGERVAPETMVRCQVCGVHLPGSEARYARGRVYCSDEHRDADVA